MTLRRLLIALSIVLVVVIVGAIYTWFSTDTVKVETPPEEDTPKKLIDRLAVAYDERDWDVYDSVYTGRVQRFLKLTCNSYEECFTLHRDSVGSPITYEITDTMAEDGKIIVDVRYTHPDGEWCQTYTVIDTEVGYRVDFSTSPADCD